MAQSLLFFLKLNGLGLDLLLRFLPFLDLDLPLLDLDLPFDLDRRPFNFDLPFDLDLPFDFFLLFDLDLRFDLDLCFDLDLLLESIILSSSSFPLFLSSLSASN